MRIKRIFLMFPAVFALLIFSACRRESANKPHIIDTDSPVLSDELLRPTNEYVLSNVPVTTMQTSEITMSIPALGTIAYDTRQTNSISARVSGRIDRLYVRYRYQPITKGQKIMDIYSPELLTAQQNLLFLLANDPTNMSLINAAKDRLLLIGMSRGELNSIIRTKMANNLVAVFSNYSGFVLEPKTQMIAAGNNTSVKSSGMNNGSQNANSELPQSNSELIIREGMYVQKGWPLFEVIGNDHVWVLLNIYADKQHFIKRDSKVHIVPEASPDKGFDATIDFVEPFFREGSRTITARVLFNNAALHLPIGSQVRGTIATQAQEMDWIPESAVLSLGINKIVFKKEGGGFVAKKINIGVEDEGRVQILNGLRPDDTIAVNGQFFMDSESFIKTVQQ